MTYLGRATGLVLTTNLNGTHNLTFQMADKFFDEEKGDFVRNEFVDSLFNECKIKLKYKGEWYEFYIKNIEDQKQFKSYMKKYTCTDAFIDELSRNGYGITFDEELYNNVEEIGEFSRVILENSIWDYAPEYNWGDFTEYLEEKLFKIPASLFSEIKGYKLNYEIPNTDKKITNVFTKKQRNLEIGDDYAAAIDGYGGYFWDMHNDDSLPLVKGEYETIEHDGYIYIPYSQMQFCYQSIPGGTTLTATEEVQYYTDSDGKQLSYAIAPTTVDPNALIQFIAIPKGATVEIDEAGLLNSKNFTYVMTIEDWNESIGSQWFYKFEIDGQNKNKEFYQIEGKPNFQQRAVGNLAAYYEGYLDKIGELEVINGKKISITDHTEINISDEIDQYVTIYNNSCDEYRTKDYDYYVNPDGLWTSIPGQNIDYRVCSKIATREVVPQLARNLVQNGTEIKTTDGWEPLKFYNGYNQNKTTHLNLAIGGLKDDTASTDYDPEEASKSMPFTYLIVTPTTYKKTFQEEDPETGEIRENIVNISPYQMELTYTFTSSTNYNLNNKPAAIKAFEQGPDYQSFIDSIEEGYQLWDITDFTYNDTTNEYTITYTHKNEKYDVYNSIVNFGIVGQEKEVIANQIYCLGISIGGNLTQTDLQSLEIKIGEGSVLTQGEYDLDDENTVTIKMSDFIQTVSADSNEERNTNKIITNSVIEGFVLLKFRRNIKNPYIAIVNRYKTADDDENMFVTPVTYYLYGLWFFEAYTKGKDQFNDGEYRYSGRNLFNKIFKDEDTTQIYSITNSYYYGEISKKIIFEKDIMPGDTYQYNEYFIQQVVARSSNIYSSSIYIADSYAAKSFLDENGKILKDYDTNATLPFSSAQFSEDDIRVSTRYIDLNACQYYDETAAYGEPDCKFNGSKLCLYQKYGYCPYLFQTEKHCRKIRTLKGEKSNRFNLTQELSKVFEVYPIYWIEHYDNGKIKTETVTEVIPIDEWTQETYSYERMKKKMFYITEKGQENKLGFRYEKNLSNISRTINSNQIVTKLYVQDVDSELSKTGLCSIKTAEDNPSKDSFILNFDYYTAKGILEKALVDADLYGKNEEDMGYLKQLGHLNTEYDKLSNLIINLRNSSFNELEANVQVNTTAIETAQKQLTKYKKELDRYKATADQENNKTYQSYITKYNEQLYILTNLIIEMYYSQENGDWQGIDISKNDYTIIPLFERNEEAVINTATTFFDIMSIKEMQESEWYTKHRYDKGMLGQYNKEYLQIIEWKKQQAMYLRQINELSLAFFKKYEPYLKEGTWSDSNYISDNAYYFGAIEVAAEGAIPKVSYNISVVDLYTLPEYEDYKFEIADTTYVEDIGMFGVNPITGLPNKLKVIISSISENLDEPMKNTIGVQNFTTQFSDLFQQVTASVQSLTFNENIYKRASNFTSNQNISQDSLQGTLDTNEAVLLNTDETNITLDKTGQSGSDINNHNNKYRLDGQGLFFSNNGGQTWNIGVGPGGINADYIKVGTLDAGKIRIVDNEYLYFLWDKNGITAFRDPLSYSGEVSFSDYAQFNRYGLSLVEKGKIRLRSGYSFNGLTAQNVIPEEMSKAGDADTETTIGDKIGFYLYNDKGATIFSTETSSLDSNDSADLTARISLVGEMYVTDSVIKPGEIQNIYVYSYGVEIKSKNAILIQDEIVYAAPSSPDAPTIILSSPSIDVNEVNSIINYWLMQGLINGNAVINIRDASLNEYMAVIENFTTQIIGGDYIINGQYYYNRTPLVAARTKIQIRGDGVIISDQDSQSYCKYDNKVYNYLNTTCSVGTDYPELTQSSSDYKAEIVQYYLIDDTTGPVDLRTETLYPGTSPYYYRNVVKEEHEVPETTGTIGLYLNNKVAWKQDAEDVGDQRIFCCSMRNETDQNIFTIKKNGNLYMGGTIKAIEGKEVASGEISDYITIEDAYLKIEDGKWCMDFDNIYDINGENLVEYIAGKVSEKKLIRHNHEIKTIQGTIDELPESSCVYLPTRDDLDQSWDGITLAQVFTMMMSSNPKKLLDLIVIGYTSFQYDTTHTVTINFHQKVPVLGEKYIINCIDTLTETAGQDSENSGGGGGTFSNWGFRDPIQ